MNIIKNRIAAVAVGATVLVGLGGVGGAVAGDLIHSKDIADGAVHGVDLSKGVNRRLNEVDNSVYRVENYKNGGGGSATVACADDDTESQKYTAIAGGVEAGNVGNQGPNGFVMSSSFPGRMDWNTGEPKPGRLDGWIVLGNGNYTDNLKVWALCVPTTSIPVQQVDLDN